MKKLDGLRFLQENFPRLTVDCVFVDKVENLDEKALIKKVEKDQEIGKLALFWIMNLEINFPKYEEIIM